MPPKLFKKGDKIEVRVQNHTLIWYPATFLHSSSDQAYVKFETSTDPDDPTSPLRRAYVSLDDVRPAQPPELHRYLMVGEIVEGFCGETKGWIKAKVEEILEHSRYSVSFEGTDSLAVVEQWEVRAVREWVNDSWIPPFLPQQVLQNKSAESLVSSRGLKLKIKCSMKRSEVELSEGMLVEVTSDMEGFLGSWFTAVVVKSLNYNKFLVEYRTLRTEDNTEYLKEEADLSCIRPNPPPIEHVKPYEYLERVDAWYNDGWWEGCISRVLKGCSYVVYFIYSKEEMTLEHYKLRPHQEWIDGKWFADLKVNPADLNLKPSIANLKRKHSKKASEAAFTDKMKVEVKSDEEGYQGSWYTAVIVCSLSSDKFLVEYQTLKMDDESALLREEAFASYIRPSPPKIEWLDRYEMLQEVDAWYNDGWWVGVVSRVLDDWKYALYFWTTNEELVFEHFCLRPHQEWIGGKWIVSSRRKPKKLTLRKKLGKYKGGYNEVGGETLFVVGMKVEVKSDDETYRGSWYPAVIIKSSERRKYLVEYQTLINEDRSQLHTGLAHALCIRPCPPVAQRKDPFKPFEEVDAWYNGGWWIGQILKAFPGRKYSVCFSTMKVILEFQHSDLRPHQDLINGQWIFSLRGTKSCVK